MKKLSSSKGLFQAVLIALVTICNPSQAQAISTKEVCEAIRVGAEDIQPQLPLDVDYATQLVGLTIIYSNSICLMTYTYMVDTVSMVDEMQRENGLSLAENLKYLKTLEGRSILQEEISYTASDLLNRELAMLSQIKNIKLVYRHMFDEGGLPSIITTVLDTSNSN